MTTDTAIRLELAEYIGWDYCDGTAPKVARPCALVPPSVVWEPGDKTDTVCCVLVAGVLGRVYDGTATWPADAWSLAMVPKGRPWGLVEMCLAAGIGRAVRAPAPAKWHVWQGWSGLRDGQVVEGSRGHQGLLAPDGRLVEATTYTDEDADGRSTDEGAVAWRVRSWADHVKRYAEVRLVELREL